MAESITPPDPRYPKGSPVSLFFFLTDGDDIESKFLIHYAPFLQDGFQGGGIALSFHPVEYKIGSRIIYTSAAPCAHDYIWEGSAKGRVCFDQVAEEMKRKEISHVIVLLEESELQDIYDGKLKYLYRSYGFTVHSYPIPDRGIPTSIKSFSDFQAKLVDLTETARVLVHCYAGLGRTEMVVAGLFVTLGNDAEKAIQMVRVKNSGSVETRQQEKFLKDYALR